ncbi:MAG TPA: outer membrane lipoprotein carrier protein LolA [Polyangiaceae bacterium]|nr:outer membrane lipoprotein carrier protein LolA [Polyangiaceae bacterium]
MNPQRRGLSTLLSGALALSATACATPAQQAPARAPSSVAAPPPAHAATPAQPVLLAAPEPAPDVAATGEPSANEIVARVQAVYDKSNGVKLGFKQRYALMAYGTQKESTGWVVAKKPSQSSWRYVNGNRVVVGGGLVQVYEKANNQLFVVPVSKSQFPAAMSFTLGEGGLERNFTFTKQDAQRMKYLSGFVVSGEPREPTSAVKRVFFYVDGQTYLVRRVLLVDAQGNRNRFDFVKTELDVAVPRDEFHLEVPPGTQILEYQGGRPG